MLLSISWHDICNLLSVCSFFSLAHHWSLDSPWYSRTLGDMLDFDSSEDLTSSVVGGIGSGRRIMKASRPSTKLTLLKLLMTLVGVLAS
jgi:hypothetical protein